MTSTSGCAGRRVREVWAHVLASGSLLASLEGLGEVSVLRARCRRILEHSRQVGCARLGDLAQVYSAWAALVGGDRAVCRALLAQVANASEWGTAALYAWKVGVEVDLVSGDAEAAWARVLDVWPVMEQAQILDATPRRLVALSVRARAGLALWAGRSACPAHVREVVRGDVMRMEREVAEHVPALVRLLRAGIAMREGDAAEAQVALRGALAGFDATGMVIHASCCRWLLASSQGGGGAVRADRGDDAPSGRDGPDLVVARHRTRRAGRGGTLTGSVWVVRELSADRSGPSGEVGEGLVGCRRGLGEGGDVSIEAGLGEAEPTAHCAFGDL
jgi:hypothetical protein